MINTPVEADRFCLPHIKPIVKTPRSQMNQRFIHESFPSTPTGESRPRFAMIEIPCLSSPTHHALPKKQPYTYNQLSQIIKPNRTLYILCISPYRTELSEATFSPVSYPCITSGALLDYFITSSREYFLNYNIAPRLQGLIDDYARQILRLDFAGGVRAGLFVHLSITSALVGSWWGIFGGNV